jgi:hypothetical protein
MKNGSGSGRFFAMSKEMEKAKLACFNSGNRIGDHFVDVTEMVTLGSGAKRPAKIILPSRYACCLTIQTWHAVDNLSFQEQEKGNGK